MSKRISSKLTGTPPKSIQQQSIINVDDDSDHITPAKKIKLNNNINNENTRKSLNVQTITVTGTDIKPSRAEIRRRIVAGSAWTELSDDEILLRRFDMNMEYGPSSGISRTDRWHRAEKLGKQPPRYILDMIKGKETKVDKKKGTINYLGDESCWTNVGQRVLTEGQYKASITA